MARPARRWRWGPSDLNPGPALCCGGRARGEPELQREEAEEQNSAHRHSRRTARIGSPRRAVCPRRASGSTRLDVFRNSTALWPVRLPAVAQHGDESIRGMDAGNAAHGSPRERARVPPATARPAVGAAATAALQTPTATRSAAATDLRSGDMPSDGGGSIGVASACPSRALPPKAGRLTV